MIKLMISRNYNYSIKRNIAKYNLIKWKYGIHNSEVVSDAFTQVSPGVSTQ